MGDLYLTNIRQQLRNARSDAELFEAIVNAPFHNKVQTTRLDLGIIVLLLTNNREATIDRIALSDTEQAAGAVKMSEKPFKDIRIPLGDKDNMIARAIESGEVQHVSDWKYLFTPALNPRAARFNQAGAGIEFSCIHPLKARGGGALIFSFFQDSKNIREAHHRFMRGYAKLVDEQLARGQAKS